MLKLLSTKRTLWHRDHGSESLLWTIVLFIFLSWEIHRFPEIWQYFEFRPEFAKGDINEYFTLNVQKFAQVLSQIPFNQTFYLVNPWNQNSSHYTHPGLISGIASLISRHFEFAPYIFRQIGIGLFCLQFFAIWRLIENSFGKMTSRIAAILFLLNPAVQTTFHAILFEPAALTFVLITSLLLKNYPKCAFLFYIIAILSDWTALIALPILVYYIIQFKRFAIAGLLSGISLSLPLFYYKYFQPVLGGAVYARETSLSFISKSAQSTVYHLKEYMSFIPSGDAFNGFTLNLLSTHMNEALPMFMLLPALFEIFARNPLKGWQKILLFYSAFFSAIFLSGLVIHAYMFLPLITFILPLAAIGWIRIYNRLQTTKAIFFLLVSLSVVEALGKAKIPTHSHASALSVQEFGKEFQTISEIVNSESVFILKDQSQWEPDSCLTYLPLARIVQSISRCPKYIIVYNEIFYKKYNYMPLTEEFFPGLQKILSCKNVHFSGKYLNLVSGSCACATRI